MAIIFFAAPMSSSTPVEAALAELEVPHEKIVLDLKQGDQKKPEYLKLNPNGKVPTLVVDGTPMFEALAIMQWLGDRYGVARGLWPAADAPQRMRALSWSTWAYVSYGSPLLRMMFASSPNVPAELHNAACAAHAHSELQQLLGLLDRELADKPYLLGKAFSLADLMVSGTIRYGSFLGAAPEPHQHVMAWMERCFARPGIRSAWG